MRKSPIVLCTLTMVICALHCAFGSVTLVDRGQPRAVIALPEQAPEVVRYAAREMQYHIRRATGAELPIVAEKEIPAGPSAIVYLGNCAASRDAGLDPGKLAPEAFAIRTTGKDIFISGVDGGGSPFDMTGPNCVSAGTLFGVYQLLEDELGVRWLWPGELGEYIPRTKRVVIRDMDKVVRPALVQRWIRTTADWHANRQEEQVWLRRNRQGNSQWLYPSHAFRNWWATYGESHPDYFALVDARKVIEAKIGYTELEDFAKSDGKRVPPLGVPSEIGLCLSEPAVWRQIVEDWQKLPLDGSGRRPYLDVSENDGGVPCSCERCEAWAPISQMSDRFAMFWLAVQKEARKVDPNATLITFAYSTYATPPVDTRLNDGIIISIVPGLPFHAAKEEVELSRSRWMGWKNTGARLYLRPNYFLQGHCMPFIFAETFGREFNFAAKNGMIGTDFDALTGMYSAQGPNLYLLARMQSRPFDDPVKLLQEYYRGFGPAAKQVKAYFDYWANVTSKIDKIPSWPYWPRSIQDLYKPEEFERGFRLLAAAKARCGNDKLSLERVNFLEKGLRNAQLCFEVGTAAARDAKSDDGGEKMLALSKLAIFRKEMAQNPYIANLPFLRYFEDVNGWNLPEEPGPGTVLLLPAKWYFKTDPNNEGLQNAWEKTSDFRAWSKINTNASWTDQGHDYHGVAWYGVVFELPAAHQPLAVRFGAVDGYCDVFLDGSKIGEQKQSPDIMWDKEFLVPMPHTKPGKHVLVVRVEKESFGAGIWKPVSIRMTDARQ